MLPIYVHNILTTPQPTKPTRISRACDVNRGADKVILCVVGTSLNLVPKFTVFNIERLVLRGGNERGGGTANIDLSIKNIVEVWVNTYVDTYAFNVLYLLIPIILVLYSYIP